MKYSIQFVLLGLLLGWASAFYIPGSDLSQFRNWQGDKRECERLLKRDQHCVFVWVPATQAQYTPKATAKED